MMKTLIERFTDKVAEPFNAIALAAYYRRKEGK